MTFSSRRAAQENPERRTMAEWSEYMTGDRLYTREEMTQRLQWAQLEKLATIEHQLDRVNNGRLSTMELWLARVTRALQKTWMPWLPVYGDGIPDGVIREGLEAAELERLKALDKARLQAQTILPTNPVLERTPR